jgi:hypothetical protein
MSSNLVATCGTGGDVSETGQDPEIAIFGGSSAIIVRLDQPLHLDCCKRLTTITFSYKILFFELARERNLLNLVAGKPAKTLMVF